MMRHTYRFDIAYDGTGFAGFRRQPGQRTVEGVLVDALRPFTGDELTQVACGGRTDRGVHALNQVISVWARAPLPLDAVVHAIDAVAPEEIVVRQARTVPRSFHASFSATGRRYCYRQRLDGELDVDRVDTLLAALVGRRCFGAFARRTAPGRSTVRHLRHASAHRDGPDAIRFEFHADAFLRRQVRVMVATALREAAAGAHADALVRLCGGERRDTAPPAEAGGLYLMGIDYG